MECPICGGEVVRPQRKYCSRECKLQADAAKAGYRRHGDGPFVCEVCQVEFTKERSTGRPPKTCSDSCARVWAVRKTVRWQKANPEKVATHRQKNWAKYYAANREAQIARSVEWKRRNPDKKSSYDAKRYALTRGAVGAELFTLDEIFERDGGICHLCNKKVRRRVATMDHIIPVSLGGPHTRANVALAHHSCNSSKGNRPKGEQLRLIG